MVDGFSLGALDGIVDGFSLRDIDGM
jgi:hypothetical protein